MRAILPSLPLFVFVACAGDTEAPADSSPPTGDTGIQERSPAISGLVADGAVVGDIVALEGTDLGWKDDVVTVTVAGEAVTVAGRTDSAITFEVPDVLPGTHPVVASVGSGDFGPFPLEVVLPRRVYVTQGLSDLTTEHVSVFDVTTDGALTEIDGSPFDLGLVNGIEFGGVRGHVALDAAHRRLFVSGRDAIAALAIDGATGALSPVEGSPFTVDGGDVYGIVLTSDGADLFASRAAAGDILHLTVAADGQLTEGRALPTGYADQLLVTPDGQFLFASANATVLRFSNTDGFLTSLGTPLTINGGFGKALSPDGTRLHASYSFAELVHTFDIGPAGELTPVDGGPVSTAELGEGPSGIAAHPDGTVIYTMMFTSGQVAILDVAANGALAARSSVETVGSPGPVAISSDGTLLFVVGQTSSALDTFRIDASGDLTSAGPPVALAKGGYPQGVVVTGF